MRPGAIAAGNSADPGNGQLALSSLVTRRRPQVMARLSGGLVRWWGWEAGGAGRCSQHADAGTPHGRRLWLARLHPQHRRQHVTVKGNSVATSYAELPNKQVSAANGVDYAYRETGEGDVPVLLLQHFRGNLDSWDPAPSARSCPG